MPDLLQIDSELNQMTRSGQILDALAQFYDEACTFQEGNEPPRIGRRSQHEHLSSFFSSLKEFNGATLHSQGRRRRRHADRMDV